MNLTEEMDKLEYIWRQKDLAFDISGIFDYDIYKNIPKPFFGPNQVNKAQHRRVKEKHFRDAFMNVTDRVELCNQYVAALENVEKKRI